MGKTHTLVLHALDQKVHSLGHVSLCYWFAHLEGVTFLVLGATGSLFSFWSPSHSRSAAFLNLLGLQMHTMIIWHHQSSQMTLAKLNPGGCTTLPALLASS